MPEPFRNHIRVTIVEDEEKWVTQIREYLNRFCREHDLAMKITCWNDGEDILNPYKAEHDIILMDIQMRFIDGMTAARKIRELDKKVIIIFLTGMMNYAVQGYEVDALDFMVKPVPYPEFARKLERALARLENQEEKTLTLPTRDGMARVSISDILFIESRSHQMIYRTKNEEYSMRGRMDDLEIQLKPHGFFRSNRGYLVNLRHVTAVSNDCCVIGNMNLPISRHRKAEFMKELTKLL